MLKRISATNRRPPFLFRLHGEIDNDNKDFMFYAEDGNISIGGHSYIEGSFMSGKSINMSK